MKGDLDGQFLTVAQQNDLGDVAGLVDNIRTMQADKGCTVLMVEHHLEVLLGLVEKVAAMYFGSIIAYDTPQKVMADPVVQQAYLGSAA